MASNNDSPTSSYNFLQPGVTNPTLQENTAHPSLCANCKLIMQASIDQRNQQIQILTSQNQTYLEDFKNINIQLNKLDTENRSLQKENSEIFESKIKNDDVEQVIKNQKSILVLIKIIILMYWISIYYIFVNYALSSELIIYKLMSSTIGFTIVSIIQAVIGWIVLGKCGLKKD